MDDVVIVAARRTPVGSFGGSLASMAASDLGAAVIRALIEETDIAPGSIDDVILGHVLTAAAGQNTARQAALAGGLPESVPALTINRQAIIAGNADAIIAGGQENMSSAVHALPASRKGQRMGNWELIDTMITDGLWCAFNNYHMGQTAENLADQFAISREDQDEFAIRSQHNAAAAINAGKFDAEIVPVAVPQRRGDPKIMSADEYPKPDSTLEEISQLRAAFKRDGSVSAANASGINDGAAAVLVMSASKAREAGLEPLAKIVASASAGVDPAIMGYGPVPAVTQCLRRADWTLDQVDLIESNEAFAAQSLTVARELKFDQSKVNVNGGAIAIGHPIGASGARILVTLLHEMRRCNVRRGLATLCIGGGQGVALAVENPDAPV